MLRAQRRQISVHEDFSLMILLLRKKSNFASASFLCNVAWIVAVAQQPVKFDSATISGLPARNIGSATMSGRVAALDAMNRMDG